MEKYVLFRVNGGIGKCIMATAVVKAIKKQYPDRKILIASSWLEPWINNPDIYRVYKHGAMPYFYDDFVKDNDILFFCEEPYNSHGYLSGLKHLINAWCDCINVPYNGETPSVYLTPEEIRQTTLSWRSEKPIMVIQPFGGMNKKYAYAWNRDIPYHQAQQIVDMMAKDFNVIQLGVNSDQMLRGVSFPKVDIRTALAIVKISSCRILIDSFAQHAAAAFNLPSVVCWITNSPDIFGYNIHSNILARTDNMAEGISSYFSAEQKYDFTGANIHDYPFKDHNVFNVSDIVESAYALSRGAAG